MKNLEIINGVQELSSKEVENTNGGYGPVCGFVGAAILVSFAMGVVEGIAE